MAVQFTRASRRRVEQELRKYSAEIAKAYLELVRSRAIPIGELEAALQAGDLGKAVRLLELTEAQAAAFVEQIRTAAMAGGALATKQGLNPFTESASTWLRERSSAFITNYNHHLPETVREVLAINGALGRSTATTALDLAGRVNKATGRREGGLVGINLPQARAVLSYKQRLAEGSPDWRQNTLRNHSFDRLIDSYTSQGKPVPQPIIDRATASYSDRLQRQRGELIARTEGQEALNFGRQEAMVQAQGALADGEYLVKEWLAGPEDGRQRETHSDMDGAEVPINEPFTLPYGDRLMYPGDSSLGASAGEIINCRCSVIYKVKRYA